MNLIFFLSVTSYPLALRSLGNAGNPALSRTAFLIPRTSLGGFSVVVSLKNCFLLPLKYVDSSLI